MVINKIMDFVKISLKNKGAVDGMRISAKWSSLGTSFDLKQNTSY